MAIVRIPRKVKKFVYEGVEFGLRPPTTKEQMEITRKMAEFQRSIKSEIKSDVADGIVEHSAQIGDLTLMTEAQQYICRWLVVDPVDGVTNVFNDAEEKVENAPADLVQAAWFCYSGQIERRPFKTSELTDLFDEAFLKAFSIVPALHVEQHIADLEAEGRHAEAHKLRIALDLKKPEVKSDEVDPPTTVADTTT